MLDETRLRDQARRLLCSIGPLAPGELARQLREQEEGTEVPDPAELREILLDDADPDAFAAFPMADGRLCDLDALLDGLTLTHVPTDEERAEEAVALAPDWSPLHLLSLDGRTFPLTDGRVAELDRDARLLRGPAGWLPDAPVLVARLVDGRIEITGLEQPPEVDQATAERLETTLRALRAREHRGIDEVELLLEGRARYPRLLDEPQAPLSDLLAAGDIRATANHGALVPADDPEADEGDGDHTERLITHLKEDHGLTDEQVRAVLAVLMRVQWLQREALIAANEALRARLEAGESDSGEAGDKGAADVGRLDAEELADVGRLDAEELAAAGRALEEIDTEAAAGDLAVALSDTECGLALVEDVVDGDSLAAVSLLGLLRQAPPATRDRSVRANAAWVASRLTELAADDHADAERELRRARELDPAHGPATFDLARYLSDRGQAGAALGLLRTIEGPHVADTIEMLAPYAQPGPMSAGRNEPCPCGSGRKHKVCCATRNGWPLTDRVDWLWHKVILFATSAYGVETVRDVTLMLGADPEEGLGDVAVLNLALFEGGLLEELCDRRGSLLPADELELLRSWSRTRAECYELVEVDGTSCTVLGLRAGERATFPDHSLSRQLAVGDALLGWLVDAGEGPEPSFGLIQVPDGARADLLDLLDEQPGATALARWLRELHAPPRLATTAGDAMVAVSRTYDVPDGAAAREALAQHLEEEVAEEDAAAGDGALLAFEERDGQRWLKGRVEVDGDRLHVSTTSLPRAAWFGELIAEVVPDAALVDEERLPIDEVLGADGDSADAAVGAPGGLGAASGLAEGGAAEGGAGGLDLDALDPETRAAVEEQLAAWMSDYEESWVDTPLPALDGATPRQAVDDPTRREAVRRLVDSLDTDAARWEGPGRGMDPDRLRTLLDL